MAKIFIVNSDDPRRRIRTLIPKRSLTQCTGATLDIDATIAASQYKSTKWSYKKLKAYMLIVRHIAESGQIVAAEFREGNATPSTDNHAFIHQCETAFPKGQHCGLMQQFIKEPSLVSMAIRLKMSKDFKELILQQKETVIVQRLRQQEHKGGHGC